MSDNAVTDAPILSAGVLRRLGAMAYDTLLLIAILALPTLMLVPFLNGKVLVPAELGWLAYMYRAFQVLVCALFFGYFWTRSKGQTLGMQAWRLRIETAARQPLSWSVAMKRIGVLWLLTLPAIAGYWLIWRSWEGWRLAVACALSLAPIVACYASIWFSSDRLAWHDRWTHTRVIVLPKR